MRWQVLLGEVVESGECEGLDGPECDYEKDVGDELAEVRSNI